MNGLFALEIMYRFFKDNRVEHPERWAYIAVFSTYLVLLLILLGLAYLFGEM